MSWTERIRNHSIRVGGFLGKSSAKAAAPSQPLVYERSPGETYSFKEGQIFLNGIPLQSLIAGEEANVSLWAGLASAIDEYRKEVWKKDGPSGAGKNFADFNAAAQGLLDLIGGRMLRVYEEVTGGIRVQTVGNRLWINNIDPRAVLTLFLANPNEERRRYLESFGHKLDLILSGKLGSSRSHGLLELARELRNDILSALVAYASVAGRCLPPASAVG